MMPDRLDDLHRVARGKAQEEKANKWVQDGDQYLGEPGMLPLSGDTDLPGPTHPDYIPGGPMEGIQQTAPLLPSGTQMKAEAGPQLTGPRLTPKVESEEPTPTPDFGFPEAPTGEEPKFEEFLAKLGFELYGPEALAEVTPGTIEYKQKVDQLKHDAAGWAINTMSGGLNIPKGFKFATASQTIFRKLWQANKGELTKAMDEGKPILNVVKDFLGNEKGFIDLGGKAPAARSFKSGDVVEFFSSEGKWEPGKVRDVGGGGEVWIFPKNRDVIPKDKISQARATLDITPENVRMKGEAVPVTVSAPRHTETTIASDMAYDLVKETMAGKSAASIAEIKASLLDYFPNEKAVDDSLKLLSDKKYITMGETHLTLAEGAGGTGAAPISPEAGFIDLGARITFRKPTPEELKKVADLPEGLKVKGSTPTVNFDYYGGEEDIKKTHAQLAEIYENEVLKARGGGEKNVFTWEDAEKRAIAEGKTIWEMAEQNKDFAERMPSDMRASLTMTYQSMQHLRDAAMAWKANPTPGLTEALMNRTTTAAQVQATWAGMRTGVGRSLNVIKAGPSDEMMIQTIESATPIVAQKQADDAVRQLGNAVVHEWNALADGTKTAQDIAKSVAEKMQTDPSLKRLGDLVVQDWNEMSQAISQAKTAQEAQEYFVRIVRAPKTRSTPTGITTQQFVDDILSSTDPKKIAKVLQPKFKDMFFEGYYGFLLSNIISHSANGLSNLYVAINGIAERAVAGVIPSKEGVVAGEASQMIAGSYLGFMDSVRAAGRAIKTGETQFGMKKVETLRPEAITGKNVAGLMNLESLGPMGPVVDVLGTTLRSTGRFMMGMDELFKGVNYAGDLRAQAWRNAAHEGRMYMSAKGKPGFVWTGKVYNTEAEFFGDRFKYYLENPTDEMVSSAKNYAATQTFTNPLGKFGTAFQTLANSHPIVKFFAPFTSTPANVFKYSAERIPGFGTVATENMRRALSGELGQVEKDLAIAKQAWATMQFGSMFLLAKAGYITGDGPANQAHLNLMKDREGWQPNSFKVGDIYVSLNRIDPLGLHAAIVANLAENMDYVDGFSFSGLAGSVIASMSDSMMDKSYFTGVSSMFDTIAQLAKRGEPLKSTGARMLARSVTPAGVRQVEKWLNPERRETGSYALQDTEGLSKMWADIKSQIPIASKTLPPARDRRGDPIYDLHTVGYISPFMVSHRKDDPVARELIKNGVPTGRVPAWVAGSRPSDMPFKEESEKEGIALKPEEWDRYQVLAGNGAKLSGAEGLAGIVAGLPIPRGKQREAVTEEQVKRIEQKTSGADVALSKLIDQYEEKKLGMWDALEVLIESDFYKKYLSTGQDGGRNKAMRAVMSTYKEAAREQLFIEFPDLQDAQKIKVQRQIEALTP